jgi:hypothetical protein
MANEMYPSLSQLLPLDKIPIELEGIKDAIAGIFDEPSSPKCQEEPCRSANVTALRTSPTSQPFNLSE